MSNPCIVTPVEALPQGRGIQGARHGASWASSNACLCVVICAYVHSAIERLKLDNESPPPGMRPKSLGMVSSVGVEYVQFKTPMALENKVCVCVRARARAKALVFVRGAWCAAQHPVSHPFSAFAILFSESLHLLAT
eukprot:scaffold68519_cov16-Tisochrysis_lutea.AAC.2